MSRRWTLKEAAWKASQPYASSWKDCAVHHDKSGAPALSVADAIPLDFTCSVSHDGEYCIAHVVTTKKQEVERISKDVRGTLRYSSSPFKIVQSTDKLPFRSEARDR